MAREAQPQTNGSAMAKREAIAQEMSMTTSVIPTATMSGGSESGSATSTADSSSAAERLVGSGAGLGLMIGTLACVVGAVML